MKLAAQVLSNTTAEAVKWFGLNNFFKCENWDECANFLKAANEWFDLLNSKIKYGKTIAANAYGTDLEQQNEILDIMTLYMQNIRVGSHKSLLPFQKDIILNNTSLQELLSYLQNRYDNDNFQIKYILTYRLNQDVIENFFSYIRGMGAANDKPSALQFRHRLRWYILGRHSSDMFIEQCNNEEDADEMLVDGTDISEQTRQISSSSLDNERMNEILGKTYVDENIDFMNVRNNMSEIDINDY